MIQVEPSASYEAVAKFPTGLEGTLGVRTIDNAGATTQARTTTGISEYPAGSGIYQVTLTAPGTAGQYSLVWDDGDGHWATDDLLVTSEVTSATIGSGSLYLTRAEFKTFKGINTAASDDHIDVCLNAACRGIDAYKKTRYYPTTETRYYAGDGSSILGIDDLNSLTSLVVDRDADGSYDETWAINTDFVLAPVNAALEGKPYTQILVLSGGSYEPFPTDPRAVKVTGSFGWAAAPAQVQEAAVLLTDRLFERTNKAPLGVVIAQANDTVAMARLGRIDPDIAFLLDELDGSGRPRFKSVQLS